MSGVVDLEIIGRRPFAEGHAFGEAGAYECIDARAHVAIDPQDPAYDWMIDIGLAMRGSDGLAHASIDLWILKPVALQRGSDLALKLLVDGHAELLELGFLSRRQVVHLHALLQKPEHLVLF